MRVEHPHIEVRSRESGKNASLLEGFLARGVGYGPDPYLGLLSPSSTYVSKSVRDRIVTDVPELLNWITAVIRIYGDLARAEDWDHPLCRGFEWGLEPFAVRLQRQSALRNDLPSIGRLDCPQVGVDHYIGEVQWKGAGEGYWSAVEDTYHELFPLERGHQTLGGVSLVNAWADAFASGGGSINTGRAAWMPSERFLTEAVTRLGTPLVSLPPEEVQGALRFDDHRTYGKFGGHEQQVRHLYLDRLSEVFSESSLESLIQSSCSGNLLLDPPPSYVFNEKLPLSLPFSREYRGYFSDATRKMLIPTSLVTPGRPDISPEFMDCVDASTAEALRSLPFWLDILKLPPAHRAAIIFKCGSAHKNDNHGGKGVYRLTGENDADIVRMIEERVVGNGEPWVVQPYRGMARRVAVAHQNQPFAMREVDMYTKFGIYFDVRKGRRPVIGGLTSFNSNWKVAGASRLKSEVASTHVIGAFRHDIRVLPE